MFTKIFQALAAAIGSLFNAPERSKPYTTENNAAFMDATKLPGTVCLIGGTGFISRGIQGAEDSFWSHCFGISKPDWCIEAEANGICEDPLSNYLNDKNQIVAYQLPLTDDQRTNLLAWVRDKIGKPYDYIAFGEELTPDPSGIPYKGFGYICSALWACAYAAIGVPIVASNIDPRVATPKNINDFLEPNTAAKQFRYNW